MSSIVIAKFRAAAGTRPCAAMQYSALVNAWPRVMVARATAGTVVARALPGLAIHLPFRAANSGAAAVTPTLQQQKRQTRGSSGQHSAGKGAGGRRGHWQVSSSINPSPPPLRKLRQGSPLP